MRVDPAVATAGSFVLPAGIIAFDDRISFTAPTEGLEEVNFPDVTENRYFQIMAVDNYGDLLIRSAYGFGWDDLLSDYSSAPRLHIVRARHRDDHEYTSQAQAIFARNPWAKHKWFRENFIRWVELMPAPSETKQGYLAYYQSPAKRVRDIRTPIKAGRWLNKYFGDILSQDEIQKYGLEWEAAFGPIDVVITQDSDEIQAVYQAAHLGSCMWFPDEDWAGSCHPARVYGGNLDLGIAYIGTKDTPVARCLVWPAKKIYFDKMYGDDYRLRNALRQAGFSAGDTDEFEGARLLRIPYNNGFVLPYVDVCENVEDNGTHLILDRYGSIGCKDSDYTEGLSVGTNDEEDQPYAECYRCDGDIWEEDNATYIYGHGNCCPHCISNYHFLCEVDGDYHRESERADTEDHWAVARTSVRHNSDWFYCKETAKWYPHSEHNEVHLFEGGTCVDDYASRHGFYCEHSDQWSMELDKALKLSNGSFVHIDSFENLEQYATYLADNAVSVVFDDPNQTTIQFPFEEAA